MRQVLTVVFATILCSMLAICVYATLERGILEAGRELMPDRWFQATLLDAYCGFVTFYAWVAYKEPTLVRRIAWFFPVMLLGNIAMSVYVLLQLRAMSSDQAWSELLLRRE